MSMENAASVGKRNKDCERERERKRERNEENITPICS